jgi:hypothetical protein
MRRIDVFFQRAGQTLLIVYFVFTMVAWLSYRESIRITDVAIEGTHAASEPEIAAIARAMLAETYLAKIDRNNRFLYPKQELRHEILTHDAHIEDVQISEREKKQLHVAIQEYIPNILWCSSQEEALATSSSEQCFLADDQGYVFAAAPLYSGYPFTVYHTPIAGSEENDNNPIGLLLLPKEEFEKVSNFTHMIEEKGVIVRAVEQLDPHDYELTLDRPWTIRFSSEKDATTTLNNLMLVLSKLLPDAPASTSPSMIDLRFGNKVFYK